MLTAHVVLDRQDSVGAVDRRLFASFAEPMGRCLYGGIFEPGTPMNVVAVR
jgi:alpha-L-arabinofuranosidase